MRWLSANWIWIVVVGGMLWMHLGMHRGHGGGGHGDHGQPSRRWEQDRDDSHAGHGGRAPAPGPAHRHGGS